MYLLRHEKAVIITQYILKRQMSVTKKEEEVSILDELVIEEFSKLVIKSSLFV